MLADHGRTELARANDIVVIAGPMAVGKSTVSGLLADRLGCPVRSFGELVRAQAGAEGLPKSRETLQGLGLRLLSEHGADGLVADLLAGGLDGAVIDGARRPAEIEALRSRSRTMCIVFLTAAPSELDRRWNDRGDAGRRADAVAHPNEGELHLVQDMAELTVDTTNRSPQAVVDRIASLVRERTSSHRRLK